LEELRHMRTLAAAVRELMRKDPVKWAALEESYLVHPLLMTPVPTNPICDIWTP
jgi:hypothetical protein